MKEGLQKQRVFMREEETGGKPCRMLGEVRSVTPGVIVGGSRSLLSTPMKHTLLL